MSPAASHALEIALDRDAEVPVGTQLAWALRARILAGALASGDRLPALHRLAADTGVNPNTVRAVYQRLEHDGLVTTRHGSGTFVTSGSALTDRHALARIAADAARAAREAGVDPRELAAALYVSGGGAKRRARRSDGEAAVRRRLRAQIAALEHALSEPTARQTSRTDPSPDERPPRTPRPRLLSAAELAEQRDELLRRLAAAHVAG